MSEDNKTHPSFGFIRASRVSGSRNLFGSAIRHQHYVEVVIGRAEQARIFHDTNVYGRDELIRVAMSEAQFAQFITSMNVGSGSPCTLTRIGGDLVPETPADQNTKQTFQAEIKAQLATLLVRVERTLERASGLWAKGKATKTELGEVKSALESLRVEVRSNLPFAMQRFEEVVEKVVQRAKIDVNAHAVMVGQLGMQGSLIALEGPVSDQDRT